MHAFRKRATQVHAGSNPARSSKTFPLIFRQNTAITTVEQNKSNLSFFGVILVIALSVAQTIFSGYVLSEMWTWFVVPLGVTAIGLAHAVGIASLGGLFFLGVGAAISAHNYESENKNRDMVKWYVMYYFSTTVGLLNLWLMGYVAKHFM